MVWSIKGLLNAFLLHKEDQNCKMLICNNLDHPALGVWRYFGRAFPEMGQDGGNRRAFIN